MASQGTSQNKSETPILYWYLDRLNICTAGIRIEATATTALLVYMVMFSYFFKPNFEFVILKLYLRNSIFCVHMLIMSQLFGIKTIT